MGDVTYCSVCLVTDVRMFEMSPTALKMYYELLSKQANLSIKQRYACYECAYLLHKYAEFKTKCCKAYRILQGFVAQSCKVTGENLKSKRKQNKLESNLSMACITTKYYLPVKQNEYHALDEMGNVVKVKTESFLDSSEEQDIQDDNHLWVEIQRTNNEPGNIDDDQEFHSEDMKTKSHDDNTQQHRIVNHFQRVNVEEVNCPAYEPRKEWVSGINVGGIKLELDTESTQGNDIPYDILSDNKLDIGSDSCDLNALSNEKLYFGNNNDRATKLTDKLGFERNSDNVPGDSNVSNSKSKKRKSACHKKPTVNRRVTKKHIIKISIEKKHKNMNKEHATVVDVNPEEAKKEHLLKKESATYNECILCYQGFKTESLYQSHMNKHHQMVVDVKKKSENQHYYNINDNFENNQNHYALAPTCEITCQSKSSISSLSVSSSSGSSTMNSDTGFCVLKQATMEKLPDEKQYENTSIDEFTATEFSSPGYTTLSGDETEPNKKGKKRKRNEENWINNKNKTLRNTGKQYVTRKHIIVNPRSVKSPCDIKCRLKCYENITADERQIIFDSYWKLGQLNDQRTYIKSCISDIIPRYTYKNTLNPRKWNKAFHFIVQGKSVRVCKTFFTRTLDISDCVIRTVINKTDENGILAKDMRGLHNNHARLNKVLLTDIKQFIEAIPRIDSHYETQSSTREYIDGGKTIADLYKDFREAQDKNNKPAGKYYTFYKVFTQEYNISLFRPKKDQCTLCVQYNSSTPEQKVSLQKSFETHLEEEILCGNEKYTDCWNIDDKNKVIVFDLQSVLQSPRGNSTEFYYKSKLNSYNFTVTILNKDVDGRVKDSYDDVNCFFWNETDARCGVNEMGSCLLKIFEKLSAESPDAIGYNLVLYSDNCYDQIKNKFIVALYLYAVTYLNIESITHKFFINGHSQNDYDNIHSLIEKKITKNLKSRPIFSPHEYVAIIKKAKKCGKRLLVHELAFDCFKDLKKLQEDLGPNFDNTEDKSTVLWNDIKVIKVCKRTPFSFFLKTSYKDREYREVRVRDKSKEMMRLSEISITNAYTGKQHLSESKKKDLRELLSQNLIPSCYSDFFNSIL